MKKDKERVIIILFYIFALLGFIAIIFGLWKLDFLLPLFKFGFMK